MLSKGSLRNLADNFFHSIWELLLLQMSGIKWGFVVNGIAWYLSAMFIGMFIIYAIVRKTRKDILIIYALLAAIFMLTYISKKYGNLNVV